MGLYRMLVSWLSPAGTRGGLSVLIFHRVMRERDPLQPHEPTAGEFEARMQWVKDCFNVLPLSEAARRLSRGTLPERALAITFDDGYADNHDLALPILRKLGLHATFFVATGYLDGGRMFNDSVIESVRHANGAELDLDGLNLGRFAVDTVEARRCAIGAILERVKYLPQQRRDECAHAIAAAAGTRLPDDLMMTSSQVAALHAAGMEIGGHTASHPILAQIDIDLARREIVIGRDRLQELTNAKVRLFAYPNGRPQRDYDRRHVSLVRDLGFDAAVSTAWGAARSGEDLFQIPRFTPWDRGNWRFGMRLAKNIMGRQVACA